jgi:hypothetical protein
MTVSAEQSYRLVDAIAAAPSVEALDELRRQARRDGGLGGVDSFLAVLIALRAHKLAHPAPASARDRIG